jgi:hypothetical protein
MKSRYCAANFCWMILLSIAFVSCTSSQSETIPLASFTENDVNVSINLLRISNGEYMLSSTFTPPEGYHLYSKDIPASGVDGLGRPTLIKLNSKSHLKAAGTLDESIKPQVPDFEPKELFVYPLGPVTLSLPVNLPPGADWVEDELSITYMACSANQCKPPVEGKIVPVRIPGADAAENK